MFDWIALGLVCVEDVEFIPKSIASTALTIQINNACNHDCSVLFITFGLSIILVKSSTENTCDYEFIQTVLLIIVYKNEHSLLNWHIFLF